MEIRLQIADKVYQALVASGNRVRGSIGLVNPKEGNFNAWKQPVQEREPGMRTIRLAHGRATVSKERARLTLSIERTEIESPYEVIDRESQEASDFMYFAIHNL